MLSIVIPVYNEEENVQSLHEELSTVLLNLGQKYEVIYVDDGSTDNTLSLLQSLFEKDKEHLRVIQLRRNFGQTAALAAGFHHANGEIIISLDGDGQNDPHDIPKLISALADEVDVVCGWRYKRRDSFLFKSLPSKISNLLNRWLNHLNIHDSGCTFRAYRKEAVENITLSKGEHRYLPAILHNQGFNITEVKVNHRRREKGKSKYGVRRLFAGLTDLITLRFLFSYGQRPIRLFSKIGVLFLLTALSLGIYLLVVKFAFMQDIGTRPLLFLTLLLGVSGFQFLLTGFIAELIVRQNTSPKINYRIRRIYELE
ncbi:MAG: glycosyltransferase family 2 protein [Candidatus Heimdallarchaeaceae archaeon]